MINPADKKIKPLFEKSNKSNDSNVQTPHNVLSVGGAGGSTISVNDFIRQQLENNKHIQSIANPVTPEKSVVEPSYSNATSTFAPSPKTALSAVPANFNIVSPKQLMEAGVSSNSVLQLLATFDNPTGIMNYGQDVMTTISNKSSAMFETTKDADAEFVDTQLRNILTLAKSLHLSGHQNTGGISGFFKNVKEKFIDVKEQMMSEFNDISTQMDRTISEVEQANTRMMNKVSELQAQYQSNIQDFKSLEQLIKDAEEAFRVKSKDFEVAKSKVTDALEAQQLQRFQANLDRLDKKIDNLKKFQLMVLQDAPDLAQKEDNAITLMEKFHTIKTMTIPLWKRQIKSYIDGLDINRAAKLANAVDDANNAMIKANSDMSKQTNIEVAKSNQRAIIDDSTAEQVHKNLLETLAEVIDINDAGRQRRIDSANRIDQMKTTYAAIQSGKTTAKEELTKIK